MFTRIQSIHQNVKSVLVQKPAEAGKLAQLAKVYSGIKPLLTALASMIFVPASWRSALAIFIAALDAVTGDVSADFKAGKDL